MLIPSSIQDRHSAGLYWLKERVEIDEASLPDYDRPLKKMPRAKVKLSLANQYALAKEIVKGLLP